MDGEKKELLISKMMTADRDRDGSLGRDAKTDRAYRKKAEDRLNGAESWKELRVAAERIADGFLNWE